VLLATDNLSALASSTSAQLAGVLSDETGSGAAVFANSPTIVTPTIASFTNATHNHQNAAGGGTLDTAALASGTLAAARMPALTGDATSTAGTVATTVAKVNGTTVPTNGAADQVLLTTAAATGTWGSVPNCGDSSHALSYATATHAFGCQSITGAGGGIADPGANGVMVRTALNTTTARTLTGNSQIAISNGDGVSGNPTFSISAGSIGSTQLAAANTIRTCAIYIGADNGSALATADIQPQKSECAADVAMTVYQIVVKADAGASTVQLAYRHSTGAAPTTTNYTSAALTPATVTNITDKVACANAAGTAITIDGISVTCSTLATQTWNAGDSIETVGGTADGTTKRLAIFISATVN